MAVRPWTRPGRGRALGFALIAAAALACSAAGTARATNSGYVWTTLEQLSDGSYRYSFLVCNWGPAMDAIFKFSVNPSLIPAQWQSLDFSCPEGWKGLRSGNLMEFDWLTDNGMFEPEDRLFGRADCGPVCGYFTYHFVNNGGTVPTAGYFPLSAFCFTFHGVDDMCQNRGTVYDVCLGTTPVAPRSWGAVKSLYR